MLRNRVLTFLAGLACGLLLLTLLGSTDIGPPNYGRYQISAWGASLGKERVGVGVFIVDTASGDTREVYSRIYGGPGEGRIVKDDLNKPFHSIR